jgi:hypothetical protein
MALSSTEAHALDHSPVGGDDFARFDQRRRRPCADRRRDPVERSVRRAAADSLAATSRLTPSARGLRLAATLGDSLREVGEQHGKPEPKRDREDESGGGFALACHRLEIQEYSQDAANVHDEHHRVAPLVLRQQLHQGLY